MYNKATEAALKVLARAGLDHLPELMAGGFVPTIKSAKVAMAVLALGYRAWNPKTSKNW